MNYALLYILTLLFVNMSFVHLPVIDLGFGLFAPASFLVGFIFVIRDYAQRQVGHFIIPAMLVGCVLTYVLAEPWVAFASLMAFAISEFVDWGVYSVSNMKFHKRVLFSSFIATPVDSIVFLIAVDLVSTATFVIMTSCKLLTAIGIYYVGEKNQEHKTAKVR